MRRYNVKALILSGGNGTRLRPLTYTNAKQLLPLANIPIIFYIIEKVVKAGIYDIGIIVGDTQEEIKKVVGNGDRWGVSISYLHQPIPLGLAHAVKTASSFIKEDDFIMVLGDNVFSMDLESLINNFYVNQANTSILLHKVTNPSEFGVAVVKDNLIMSLVEKPKEFISDLIVTGVYIFDKSIFMAIDNIKPSQRGELEITDAIQKQLEIGERVTFELIQGWWKDTGELQDILEANRLMLSEIDDEYSTLSESNSIFKGKIHTGKNVVIKNCNILGPVAIADDVIITNSYIGPYTSIGKAVRINDCEIENCIILENVEIYCIHKRISGSLIGKNVQIKKVEKRPHTHTFLVGDNSEIYI
jgi:glucose-1-phosphate thymidylyltransferase